tara:strand:+ start:2256 stop:2537 length:282 start_codon:yes stop_codon:yes gene_type:complete
MNKIVDGVLIAMTDAEIAELKASDPSESEKTAQKWALVRAKRNIKLQETDWVVSKASETGVAVSDDWKTYRQALRDVPTQSDPDNIAWPTEPS